ncbi:MAG: hypothetical protein ACREA0_25310, partial [bacterium]
MRNELRRSVFCVIVLVSSSALFAQRPAQRAAERPEAAAKPAPRTPDGKPDLSGTWSGGAQTEGGQFAVQTGGHGTMELTKWGKEKITWNRVPETASAP